jgi:hypothetical protein
MPTWKVYAKFHVDAETSDEAADTLDVLLDELVDIWVDEDEIEEADR